MKLTASLLLASSLAVTSFSASAVDLTKVSCNVPVKQFRAALLQATNQARAKARRCGSVRYARVAPVKWNNALRRAAWDHSRDMANNNFFSHTGSNGLKSWDRARNRGYRYNYIGENIAAGYGSVASVQSGWLRSAGHCRNIMKREYTEMGAACIARSKSDYKRYWTVVFGKRF